jgi:hypothetical protein
LGTADADTSSVVVPRPRQSAAVLFTLLAILGLGATSLRAPQAVHGPPTGAATRSPSRSTAPSALVRCEPGTLSRCLHADVPPPGVDVRIRPTTALLRTRDGAGDDAVEAAQDAGVAAAAKRSTAVSCDGDGTSGDRVQAMYVVASDRPNRFTAIAPSIRAWAAGVDDVFNRSAALTGGVRHVRFVTTGTPQTGCTAKVVRVVVPKAATKSFDATIAAVRAAGYNSAARKYLMWVDATVYCGIAEVYSDSRHSADNLNNGYAPQFARIDSACWGFGNSVEAHELTHTLGAVQGDAPHHTLYGHCFDEYDRMCYNDGSGIAMREVCPAARDSLLDCRADDYFSTAPGQGSYLATHWNTADSRWLIAGGKVMGAAPSVSLTANSMVPGLPTQISASAAVPHGRRVLSMRFTSNQTSCRLSHATATAAQATMICPAGLHTAPSVRVTVTDSASRTTSATTVISLDSSARPASLKLLVDGERADAGAWCPITGTLTGRLVDDATRKPVAGIPVRFTKQRAGGPATPFAPTTTGLTGSARATTKLTAHVVGADSRATGPWAAGNATTGQPLRIRPCTSRLTTSVSATSIRAGGTVSVQGTLRGVTGTHSTPAVAQQILVEVRPRGKQAVLVGRATVDANGRWHVVVKPKVSGSLVARFAGVAGLRPVAVRAAALTVR